MFSRLGAFAADLFGESSKGLTLGRRAFSELGGDVDPLWKYLPYETYDPKTGLFLNQSSTGFVLKGRLAPGLTLSDQAKLDKFFSQRGNLEEGTSMQFLLVASPRIQELLDFWKSYRTQSGFERLAQRRYEYLQSRAFDQKHPLRDFHVLISYMIPEALVSPYEKEKMTRIRSSLQGSLEKIGVFADPLDDKGLVREVGNILNFKETTSPYETWWSDYEDLARLIPSSDLAGRVTSEGFLMREGQYIAHTFLPRTTPKYWALAHMDKLFGDVLEGSENLPCSFIMHYGFTVCSRQGWEKKRALGKRESLENSLNSRLGKWQSGLEEEFEETSEIVKEIQQGEKIVDACLSLTTFSKRKDLPRIQNTLESIWNTHGWSSQSATYGHTSLFLGSLPLMWSTGRTSSKLGKKEVVGAGPSLTALGLTKKTITKESQNLLPVVGEWAGQIAPGIPLQGRRGQICFWNPFDGLLIPQKEFNKPSGNFNFCITGISGSGKSFLCNEIIKNTIEVGGKAFVLDKGGSFKNLCEPLGGHHISFDFSKSFSLNPFTHIPYGKNQEETKLRNSLFKALLSIVTQMAFPSGEQSDVEEAFLKEALYDVWNTKKNNGTIDDVRDFLMNQEDLRAKDIARSLVDFTTSGLYGGFFNPPANIDISSDFIVVETDNLEEPLKSVMIMLFMVQVTQRMLSSDRTIPYLVLIDEAWDLLRGKATGDFIEGIAVTTRKYRFSLGVATQSMTHFFKDGLTGPKAAWENSAWKVIFNQESDTLSGLKSHPQLGEYVKTGYREALLRSLQPAKEFSEFALFHNNLKGVPLRLFCDPYTTLLYSTNAQEVAEMNTLQKSGLSLDETIQKMLEERKGGGS